MVEPEEISTVTQATIEEWLGTMFGLCKEGREAGAISSGVEC
jgi:hypothetical protein